MVGELEKPSNTCKQEQEVEEFDGSSKRESYLSKASNDQGRTRVDVRAF